VDVQIAPPAALTCLYSERVGFNETLGPPWPEAAKAAQERAEKQNFTRN
jgi:hypothetical protein